MRILHVLDHSIPLETSYAFRTQAMLEGQRELGWETFQLTGPKQGPAPPTNEEDVGTWHFYRTPPPGGLLEGVPVLEEVERIGEITYRIERIVRRMRPHILHAHSPVLNAISALRVGRRLGLPVVYEIRAFWEDASAARRMGRGRDLRYRATRRLETWALRRAKAVVALSDGLRADIVARGIPGEKVAVVPSALDARQSSANRVPELELKRRLGLEGATVLGFVGTFHAHQGVGVLLQALPRMLQHRGDLRVLLLGDGPQEPQLRQLAADLGVLDKVVFAGRVAHTDLPRYRDLIEVTVYPCLSTRLTELVTPLTLLEAMAQGGLVVASDVGGSRELIRHGESGVLFAPADPAALTSAVTDLLAAPDRWPTIRAAARHFVETERSRSAVMARYRGVYDRVMQ